MSVVTEDFANFEAVVSIENPIADYEKLMEEKMKAEVIMTNDIYKICWKKISEAARETLWKLLFDEEKQQLHKAAELLKIHKEDACFYSAVHYNNWIVLVRDELLKRDMVSFWKNQIVDKELGPCWARDSDLFDDTEDPAPENFYKYAGCTAPWLNKNKTEAQHTEATLPSSLADTETPTGKVELKKISVEQPLEDYKYNMEALGDISADDDDVYKEIFKEARDMLWLLLFGEPTLTSTNFTKAADLLEEYKRDACFFAPWEYNDWIQTVKDELIKRKYIDFWKDVIVKNQLGLCWAQDSDYFDDMEDPKPLEFYKLNEEVTKQQNN